MPIYHIFENAWKLFFDYSPTRWIRFTRNALPKKRSKLFIFNNIKLLLYFFFHDIRVLNKYILLYLYIIYNKQSRPENVELPIKRRPTSN